MKGVYEGFPDVIHKVAFFSYKIPTRNLQKMLILIFYRMNMAKESLNMPFPSSRNLEVVFEIGIADGLEFIFLDDKEKDKWLKFIEKETFRTLDFLCIIRYYVPRKRRKVPLKFDYYMLRFIFKSGTMEVAVHHERGTRRLTTRDLITMINEQIDSELKKERKPPLGLESLDVL